MRVRIVLPHPHNPNPITMPSPQSKRWCFTINNYTAVDVLVLTALADNVTYLVFGREVGETGTPHLQGYVIFNTNHRLNAAKQAISPRAHLEVARGTNQQASDYCKKDNDYQEFGILPGPVGRTQRFDELKQWVIEQPSKPSAALVAQEYPGLFLQYGRIMEWIDLIYPVTIPVDGEYRLYQQVLANSLEQPPDSRKIQFIVDETGNTGKSWFIKRFLLDHPDEVQILSIGKRDDLAHTIDPSKKWFLFDLPRSGSEYLQYTILEQLKDRFVFSPKYQSRTKILEHLPHVVVFMNEHPDMTKLSNDRYQITNWWTI